MRVDFSSRNPYSDGAEWKWRLKDKDDHVIEGVVLCQDLVQVKMRNFSPF